MCSEAKGVKKSGRSDGTSKRDDEVSGCEEEKNRIGGAGGCREEGMRIENVCRIRKAELGQRRAAGGFEAARGM